MSIWSLAPRLIRTLSSQQRLALLIRRTLTRSSLLTSTHDALTPARLTVPEHHFPVMAESPSRASPRPPVAALSPALGVRLCYTIRQLTPGSWRGETQA